MSSVMDLLEKAAKLTAQINELSEISEDAHSQVPKETTYCMSISQTPKEFLLNHIGIGASDLRDELRSQRRKVRDQLWDLFLEQAKVRYDAELPVVDTIFLSLKRDLWET
jgi:hypothetical protein